MYKVVQLGQGRVNIGTYIGTGDLRASITAFVRSLRMPISSNNYTRSFSQSNANVSHASKRTTAMAHYTSPMHTQWERIDLKWGFLQSFRPFILISPISVPTCYILSLYKSCQIPKKEKSIASTLYPKILNGIYNAWIIKHRAKSHAQARRHPRVSMRVPGYRISLLRAGNTPTYTMHQSTTRTKSVSAAGSAQLAKIYVAVPLA